MIAIDSASIALVFFCVVQLVITFQRLIFDFLGFQYALIIFNFINLIFDLFGIFGSFQRRVIFIVCNVAWSLVYISFNLFVVCFYLEIGFLRRDNSWVLSLVDSERTWWFGNLCGPILLGNLATATTNSTESSLSPLPKTTTEIVIPRPDQVSIDCVFPYYYVEVLQAGIQVLLSFCSFICAVTAATHLHNLKDVLGAQQGASIYDSRGEPFTFEQPEVFKNRQSGYRGGQRGTIIDALSVESFRPDSREGVLNGNSRQNYVAPIPAVNSRQLNGMVPVDLSTESLNDRRPLMNPNPGFTSSVWIPSHQVSEPNMQYQVSPHTTATSATVRSVDSFRMAISGPEPPTLSSSHPVTESIPLRSLNQRGNPNVPYYEPAQQSSFVNMMPNNNTRPSPYVFIPPAR